MAKAHHPYSWVFVFAGLVVAAIYVSFLCESGSIISSLKGHGAAGQSHRRLVNKKQVVTKKKGHNQQYHHHHYHIPNFLLAGTQKSGSTAVADYMFQRKDVCGPKARMGLSFTAKEAHFFDEDDQLAKGLKHYESLFDHCDPEKTRIYMDATPKYQLHPHRVHQFYKEASMEKTVKIMFTLREPVSRDMSWYNHLLRESNKSHPPEWAQEVFHNLQNHTVKTFEDYATQNIAPLMHGKNPTHRGLYAKWLKQWFRLFDRKQILIASYDDLRSDPADFLQRLHAFLELPAPKRDHLPHSNGKKARNAQLIPCEVQEQLAKAFEIPNEQLYHLLETHPGPAMEKRPFTKFNFQCKEM